METDVGANSLDRVVVQFNKKDQTLLSYCLALVLFFILSGLFYFLVLFLLYCLYHIIIYWSLLHVGIILSFMATTLYPSKILWQQFIDVSLWKALCEYFSYKVIIEGVKNEQNELVSWYQSQTKKNDKQFMFVEFPHGVVPFGFILSATVVQKLWPGLKVEGVIASILFKIPIICHLCRWFGSREATESNINKLIDKECSVGIMACGIAELFLTSREHERIYLKNRRGFVKIALKRGTPIVPIYYFGHTQLYDFVGLPGFSRKMRVATMAFYGRWFLPIPYQHPITMVIGKPIDVEKVDNPTREQINALHTRFTNALIELFNKHKKGFRLGTQKS